MGQWLLRFSGCLSTRVFLFGPCTCWFIFRVSEDLDFLKFSSTSAPWSPMDIATVSSALVLHKLGLCLGGFSAPANFHFVSGLSP